MPTADSHDTRRRARIAAGEAAAVLIEPGMIVGLGTGDTASIAIEILARREVPGIRGVPTSSRTAALAERLGVPLVDLDEVGRIDLTLDGADEVDPRLQLIKGGGGALLREKLVALSSRRVVILADRGKLVPHLGDRFALPVEVVPFGAQQTLSRLRVLAPQARMRDALSDGGNRIVDLPLSGPVADLPELHRRLKLLPGVIETGLFLDLAHQVLVGLEDGTVEVLHRSTPLAGTAGTGA